MLDTNRLHQFRDLVQSRSGLFFDDAQLGDLQKGLSRAMELCHYNDVEAYLAELETRSLEDMLWKELVSVVTIGETYFFRNSAHFYALKEGVLPAIIERRRRYGLHNLRIWSAGCSSGEEPYSIAILLRELIPDIDAWTIKLFATDINEQLLSRAKKGVYRRWSFRNETPLAFQEKYFRQRNDDEYEILPEIRRMVDFAYLNLVDDLYPSPMNDTLQMDLIVCRNVTIYFDRDTTRQIVSRFYRSLVEGGWLLVGHSEPLVQMYSEFETRNFPNAVIYRKPAPNVSTQTMPQIVFDELDEDDYDAIAVSESTKLNETDQAASMEAIYQLMHEGEMDLARQRLSEFLEHMPQHIDALFLLAKFAADDGQTDWVYEILDSIDELNPLVPQAHYLRALLQQQSESWQAAKSSLRKALYADREFALAHYYMGELLYTEGNTLMAKRSWQNAIDLLKDVEAESPIPFGDGLMAGTLLHAIEQRLSSL